MANRGRPLRAIGPKSSSTTFAAQAAIALRSVDLVRALEAGTDELARKVDQLEALGEVGQAVSSSLDLDEVLVDDRHARRAAFRDGRWLDLRVRRADQEFHVRTAFGTSTELLDALRRTRIGP